MLHRHTSQDRQISDAGWTASLSQLLSSGSTRDPDWVQTKGGMWYLRNNTRAPDVVLWPLRTCMHVCTHTCLCTLTNMYVHTHIKSKPNTNTDHGHLCSPGQLGEQQQLISHPPSPRGFAFLEFSFAHGHNHYPLNKTFPEK